MNFRFIPGVMGDLYTLLLLQNIYIVDFTKIY